MKIKISIVIVCFNGSKYIAECLDSISKNSNKNYEVIVVDDNSQDGSLGKLKKYQNERIKIFRNKENRGASFSRNYGERKAAGEIIVFLDIDTKIDKNCLENINKYFDRENKLGAGQFQILNQDRSLQTAGHYLTLVGMPYEIGGDNYSNKLDEEIKILGARGAGMAIRKEVFEKIDGFDEDYVIYGEETDLCMRVWRSGYEVKYLPKAKIIHFGRSSLGKLTSNRVYSEGCKNSISNLIKNLDWYYLVLMLPLNICFWLLMAIIKLVSGKGKEFSVIIRAMVWNLVNIKKTLMKRKKTNFKQKINRKIWFGELSLIMMIKKGLRWICHN